MIQGIASELLEIDAQLDRINQELESLKERSAYHESLIANLLNAKAIYKTASIAQKKAILNMLINRIEVSDTNDADIFLNI